MALVARYGFKDGRWQQLDTSNNKARQTLDFMQATSNGHPHVLLGDLNVWTAAGVVCRQTPNGAAALDDLSKAQYVDAWHAVRGEEAGDTGMLNRKGCGEPEGAAWKPSDHYGIIATYPGIRSGADVRRARQTHDRRWQPPCGAVATSNGRAKPDEAWTRTCG